MSLRMTTMVLVAVVGAALPGLAQGPLTPFDRLPSEVFDVTPPTARVAGDPGSMTIRPVACRSLPLAAARERIVQLAVQEWGYFGFPVVEYTDDDDDEPGVRGRNRNRPGGAEAERVAASIGGYWAVAPGGAWILQNQNQMWRDADGVATRWRFPWSAAFISWLMCEGGLGSSDLFQRAIAHHTYIDQAIRARDAAAPRAAYVAYDPGELAVAPGDMLCSSRRPIFRTIADRRRQLGQGARTHCDVVVKVDERAQQILAVGGNVRGVVGLKIFPAARMAGGLRPNLPAAATTERPMFAHLRLRGPVAGGDVFDSSPTLTALSCTPWPRTLGSQAAAARLLAPEGLRCAS